MGPGCKLQKIFMAGWSYGGQYRHLTGPAGVGLHVIRQPFFYRNFEPSQLKLVDKSPYQTPSKNTKLRTAHLHDI
jgi:hypothetical protein